MAKAKFPQTLYFDDTPTSGKKIEIQSADQAKTLDEGWHEDPTPGVSYEAIAVAVQLAPEGKTPEYVPPSQPAPLKPEDNTERGRLVFQAESIGMPVDYRWSNETLREFIKSWQAGGEWERDEIKSKVKFPEPERGVRKMVEDLGYDLKDIKGKGADGQVLVSDVKAYSPKK